ncbi:RAMP superfamily CRISPR-associated protein [Paraglaciecola sp. Hal342]
MTQNVFRQLPKSLSSIAGCIAASGLTRLTALARATSGDNTTNYACTRKWVAGWGGTTSLTGLVKSSQLLPYTETVIDWHNEKASLKTQTLVMPGSSIKGAFSHRFEFHYRRLTQQWAQKDKQFTYRDTNTRQLFGWVDGEEGQKGHFWSGDSYVMSNVAVHHRTRNKIDRLTGGTIDKALFAEERVYNDSLTIEFIWDHQALKKLSKG